MVEKLSNRRMRKLYNGFQKSPDVPTNPDLESQLAEWQGGKWQSYFEDIIRQIPVSFRNKVVVDFGCRYGLLFPLLREAGAKKIFGIEDLDLFCEPGKHLFHPPDWNVEFLKSEHGYIPLQPESVDIVIMKEVISHINPQYLSTVFSEAGRILTTEGVLFVSDGNNLGYPPYLQGHLVSLYEALENGPDGTRIGDVMVPVCFLNQRKRIIQSRHHEMPQEQVDFVAQNTSGLCGEYLLNVVDRYARTGELIRRPFRRQIAPVYPDWGQVEERGFYPEQIVYDLNEYGFECTIADQAYCLPASNGRIHLDNARMHPAPGYAGFSYQIPIPKECGEAVELSLIEDDKPLPHPTDNHGEIAAKGMGRYCIWRPNNSIYLSSSDNSNPRLNKKRYELYWTQREGRPTYGSAIFHIVARKKH